MRKTPTPLRLIRDRQRRNRTKRSFGRRRRRRRPIISLPPRPRKFRYTATGAALPARTNVCRPKNFAINSHSKRSFYICRRAEMGKKTTRETKSETDIAFGR